MVQVPSTLGFKQFGVQLLGEVCVFIFVVAVISLACVILKHTIGIRVSDEDQLLGMDISEHNTYAYDYLEENYEEATHEHEKTVAVKPATV